MRVIRLTERLPTNYVGQTVGKQVLRSATSVGANYRAACRARSTAERIAKLEIVEEEADETLFWLEIIYKSGMLPQKLLDDLMGEVDEIIAMVVSLLKTLNARQLREKSVKQIKDTKFTYYLLTD